MIFRRLLLLTVLFAVGTPAEGQVVNAAVGRLVVDDFTEPSPWAPTSSSHSGIR